MRAPTISLILLFLASSTSGQTQSTWTGDGPDMGWSTPQNWSPELVPNNDDMNTFDVFTDQAVINLGENITISSLALNQGSNEGTTLAGTGQTLVVYGPVTCDFGRFTGFGTFQSQGEVYVLRELTLDGAWEFTPTMVVLGNETVDANVTLDGAATLDVTGTFEFARDGDISLGTGATASMSVTGTLKKTGGIGVSNIDAPFTMTSGTVSVSSGAINFANQLTLIGTLKPASDEIVISGGPCIINATLDPASSGNVEFIGADVETMSLSGIAGETGVGQVFFSSGTSLKATTLDLDDIVRRAIVANATMDGVMNNGIMEWNSGKVTGAGFTNNADGTLVLTFRTGVTTLPAIEDATFDNAGYVGFDRNLELRGSAVLNHTGGEFDLAGGFQIVGQAGGDQNSMFNQSALLVMDPGSNTTAQILVPTVSTGPIEVYGGNLRFSHPTEGKQMFTGPTVSVTGVDSLFSIGANSLSRSQTNGMSFTLSDSGVGQWFAGDHIVKGSVSSAGIGEVRNESATMRVPSGDALTLNCDPTAPFVMRTQNAALRAEGSIENLDSINWEFGMLSGLPSMAFSGDAEAGALTNVSIGNIDVEGFMRISDGNGGVLINNGIVQLSGASNQGIAIDTNGLFENNGTLSLTSNQNVTLLTPGAPGMLASSGTIQKLAGTGESLMTCNLDLLPGSVLSSQKGSIRLFGDSMTMNEATLKTSDATAVLAVQDDSTSEDLTFELNGGAVHYLAIDGDTVHEVAGTLASSDKSSDGFVKTFGGTMKPRDAMMTLDLKHGTYFEHGGGTLGESGKTVTNKGIARMSSGNVVGTTVNDADAEFTFDGGTITGTLTNNGRFEWVRGTMDAQMTSTGDESILLLENPFLSVLLAADSSITSNEFVLHCSGGALELGENAQIVNNGADPELGYVFLGGGDIRPNESGLSTPRFINNGRVANQGDQNSAITVGFMSVDGTIEATGQGKLEVRDNLKDNIASSISGGFIKVATSTVETFSMNLLGSIIHECGDDAVVNHQIANVNGNMIATGGGSVVFEAFIVDQESTCLLSPQSPESNITISDEAFIGADTSSSGGGTLTLDNTNMQFPFELFAPDFLADCKLLIKSDETGVVLLGQSELGIRNVFTLAAGRVAQLTGNVAMELKETVEFKNLGEFQVVSPAGSIDHDEKISNSLFTNTGTFVKTDASIGNSVVNAPFDSTGTVRTQAGQLSLTDCESFSSGTLEEGTWIIRNGSTITLDLGETMDTNQADVTLQGSNSRITNLPYDQDEDFLNDDDGKLRLIAGANFEFLGEYENDGFTEIGPGSTLDCGTLDNDGTLIVNGILNFDDDAFLQSGQSSGTGLINGMSIMSAGTTAPGTSPGELTFNANLTCTSTHVLDIELAGTAAGTEYDVLTVTGSVALDGSLSVTLLDGFLPDPADTFQVLAATTLSGHFTNAVPDGLGMATVDFAFGSFVVHYLPTGITLSDFSPSGSCGVASTPMAENALDVSCLTDADCGNLSVCAGGACYVPKQKYLSIRPAVTSEPTGLRVTLSASDIFPATVGSSWWVQDHADGDPPNIYRLGCEPFYADWSAAPLVIHLADRQIATGAIYDVQAITDGCSLDMPENFSLPLTLPTVSVWGDCCGSAKVGVIQPPDGLANFTDILAAVLGFQNAPNAPDDSWIDIDGEVPNGIVNLADVFRFVQGFQGQPYAYEGPAACP